jgi:hypothetical protein
MLVRIHIIASQGRNFRLWIPIFLIWLLLLPFALVLLPAFFVLALVLDFDPFAALGTVLRFIGSMHGTHIEVDSPDAFVFVHVL